MNRVTGSQSKRIAGLQSSIGDRTLRTLLAGDSKRIMRPERLAHLSSGSGRLSEAEAEQLERVSKNVGNIKALKRRGKNRRDFQANRAIRTWLTNGKRKGVDISLDDELGQERKRKAIRALRYLGVDPDDGAFYVRE